jgi:hypothetical protein
MLGLLRFPVPNIIQPMPEVSAVCDRPDPSTSCQAYEVRQCFLSDFGHMQTKVIKHRGRVVNIPASYSEGLEFKPRLPETGYPEFFHNFPQFLHANDGIL